MTLFVCNRYALVSIFLIIFSLTSPSIAARFEPLDGRILVMAGQNLDSTRAYYSLKDVPRPAGFSDYISIQEIGTPFPNYAPDFPAMYQGVDGLREPVNWGAGEQCVDCLLQKPGFDQTVITIGMYLGGPWDASGEPCSGTEQCIIARIPRGDFDDQLGVFARWLNERNDRPVLLRIGYEFDGPWNGYEPEAYKGAFKYIRRFLDTAGVKNVAYVWQSFGYASYETLKAYFPLPDEGYGEYVDWIGYSYFTNMSAAPGVNELKFARENGLKAIIAEVTPHSGVCTRQYDIERDGDQIKEWMDKFFTHLDSNKDVVRAFSYINARWNDTSYAPMWSAEQTHNCAGFFADSNARLNDNDDIAKYWGEKVSSPAFLNKERDLYQKLLNN